MKKKEKEKKKCYTCREEYDDNGAIFCDKCIDAPRPKHSSVYVIYDKM